MSLVQVRPSKSLPPRDLRAFLPTTPEEMAARGWDQLDILLINGDAYVDHPAFGGALIGRFLEGRGYRVGVISQPAWSGPEELLRLGRPRLFVGVTAGNLDSMLNKLTAQKKIRSEDHYSPGGALGMRPNRATIVYANLARQAFPGVPIVLGGIEASLRRIAHYDYWSDQVRRSVLLDAKADLWSSAWASARSGRSPSASPPASLSASSATSAAPLTCSARASGRPWSPAATSATAAPCCSPATRPSRPTRPRSRRCRAPSSTRPTLATAAPAAAARRPRGLLQPARAPLETADMDGLYDLPFTAQPPLDLRRRQDPRLRDRQALDRDDARLLRRLHLLLDHRARGADHPVALAESVLREVRALRRMDDFRGVITDVGGPTANMYQMRCKRGRSSARAAASPACTRASARTSRPTTARCSTCSQGPRERTGSRRSSSPRASATTSPSARPSSSGARRAPHRRPALGRPEHVKKRRRARQDEEARDRQLRALRRAGFMCASEAAGKEQHLVPYFISGHPGCTSTT
jgi:hypothetical protein